MNLFSNGLLCVALIATARAGGPLLPASGAGRLHELQVTENNFKSCAKLFGDARDIISQMSAQEQAGLAEAKRILLPCIVAYKKSLQGGEETVLCIDQLQESREYPGNDDAAYMLVVELFAHLLCAANNILVESGRSRPTGQVTGL